MYVNGSNIWNLKANRKSLLLLFGTVTIIGCPGLRRSSVLSPCGATKCVSSSWPLVIVDLIWETHFFCLVIVTSISRAEHVGLTTFAEISRWQNVLLSVLSSLRHAHHLASWWERVMSIALQRIIVFDVDMPRVVLINSTLLIFSRQVSLIRITELINHVLAIVVALLADSARNQREDASAWGLLVNVGNELAGTDVVEPNHSIDLRENENVQVWEQFDLYYGLGSLGL